MKQNERVYISMFFSIKEIDLKSFLRILCHTRNLCAHDERLYNYIFPTNETINDTKFHKLLNIPNINGRFRYGKDDLFAVMVSLKMLLNKDDYKKFHTKVFSRIMSINSKIKSIPLNTILEHMHFPENWHELLKMS